jgi:hypothetical protein
MADRPPWVRKLLEDLDELIDHPSYTDADDTTHDLIEVAVKGVLCSIYGHEVINDMCMIPAHRYCVHCGRLESRL